MAAIGVVESLWRYPVKSMRGEEMTEVFMGFAGIYGDRCFAFRSSAARKGFPYLNATLQEQMVSYRPRFRYPERAAKPPNLDEARTIAPGATPVSGEWGDLMIDVVTPSGAVLPVDDPALIEMLGNGIDRRNILSLVRSDRSMTDCRPVSLVSMQTVRQFGGELGMALDKRRFRMNIYVDLFSGSGFSEDRFVGHRLRIGSRAVIAVLERDPRCKMISLDPDSGDHNPNVLRKAVELHESFVGVYCAVLVEGSIAKGDAIDLLDEPASL
jgi:hypothetical protein